MIITMIIGAIVIALVYNLLLYIKKEWTEFDKRQQQIRVLMAFRQTLQADIDNASILFGSSNDKLDLVNKDDTISYVLRSPLIRIDHEQKDTFFIAISNVRFRYIDFLKEKNVVKAIWIDLDEPVQIKESVFDKFYSSDDLVSFAK